MYKSGNPNYYQLIAEFQQNLDAITRWADNWGFKISGTKTLGMLFSPHNRRKPKYPTLYIQGTPIQFVKQPYFLGMLLDENLNWKPHINELIKRTQQDINLIKHLKGTTWGADQTTLLMLYRSLIRSKWDYGCQIYASANEALLRKLDALQYRILRLCTGTLPNTSLQELQVLTGELPLQLRREEHILRLSIRKSTHEDTNQTKQTI